MILHCRQLLWNINAKNGFLKDFSDIKSWTGDQYYENYIPTSSMIESLTEGEDINRPVLRDLLVTWAASTLQISALALAAQAFLVRTQCAGWRQTFGLPFPLRKGIKLWYDVKGFTMEISDWNTLKVLLPSHEFYTYTLKWAQKSPSCFIFIRELKSALLWRCRNNRSNSQSSL